MGDLQEKADDVNWLIGKLKVVVNWSSKNVLRRLGFMLLLSSIIVGGSYYYVDQLVKKVSKEYDLQAMKLNKINKNTRV